MVRKQDMLFRVKWFALSLLIISANAKYIQNLDVIEDDNGDFQGKGT